MPLRKTMPPPNNSDQPAMDHAARVARVDDRSADGRGRVDRASTQVSNPFDACAAIEVGESPGLVLIESVADERWRARHERSRPVMEKLRAWLMDAIPRVPPQSLTGKALGYLDNQWPKLVRVLDDGRVPLDTNGVENAIRPFVIGRKNWLFAATVRGAEASANLYSVIETAKRSGLEPFAYLRHVLAELPRATTLADIEAILPRHVDPGRLQDGTQFSPVG